MESVAPQPTTNEDLLRGCIFGGLCGDAIGAYLEFMPLVTPKEVEKALTLPGGGAHKIGKGQVTDDSELMLSLGHGLVDGKGVLNLNKIAEWYGKWAGSKPFDMGNTMRNAVHRAAGMTSNQARMMRKGAQSSEDSQSNGALMRIAPLCVWCHKLSKEDLMRAVAEETKLSHPNKTTIDVSIVYVYTIQYLFKNKGDYEGAFRSCKEMAEHLKNQDILSWIKEVEENKLTEVHKAAGWVKHAFCYGMYYLKNNKDYVEAIKDVISRKGDTDTNACIIGALLGALHGFEKLPKDTVKRVLEFDPSKEKGRPRPPTLVPGKVVEEIITKIIANAPETLKIVGEETADEKVPKTQPKK